jgi:hypothetical protein
MDDETPDRQLSSQLDPQHLAGAYARVDGPGN